MRKILTLFLGLQLTLTLSGCSDGSDSSLREKQALQAVLDFESYTWREVSAGGYWDPRAGLQTVELNDRFFLLGGRTPNPPHDADSNTGG